MYEAPQFELAASLIGMELPTDSGWPIGCMQANVLASIPQRNSNRKVCGDPGSSGAVRDYVHIEGTDRAFGGTCTINWNMRGYEVRTSSAGRDVPGADFDRQPERILFRLSQTESSTPQGKDLPHCMSQGDISSFSK